MNLTWRTFPRFFRTQFIAGFCFHWILPVTLLLLAGLTLGWLGGGLGLFYLVWHEDPVQQGLVGFAMFVLAWEVVLVGYLLETKRTAIKDRYRLSFAGPAVTYFLGILVSLGLVLGIIAGLGVLTFLLFPNVEPDPGFLLTPLPDMSWSMTAYGLPFALGALLAFLLGLYMVSLHRLDPMAKPRLTRLGSFVFRTINRLPWVEVEKPDEEDLYLHGAAAISWLFSFVFFLAFAFVPAYFSPVLGVCFLLHGLIAVYAFLVYFNPGMLPAVLVALLALLWLGGLPQYKQRFPGLERYYEAPVTLKRQKKESDSPKPDPSLLTVEQIDFCGRELGIHKADTKRPLVIVCVSGGGLRSATWTYSVLRQLEKQLKVHNIQFPYHVRLFTGASGGMLGAAVYTQTLPEPGKQPPRDADTVFTGLTKDCLSPTIKQFCYGDLGTVFWPARRSYDRGEALEETWHANLDGLLNVGYLELYEGERAGWKPSLVFSPMLVEDGRRLLISNLDLNEVGQNRSNLLQVEDDDLLSTSALELFRLFPHRDTRERFRLSTAVRMNASFPYVTPAAPLPTAPRRRVVDAGYFDNYGVTLAASWLTEKSTIEWMQKNISGVLLLQIRDGQSEDERRLERVFQGGSRPITRGLEGLTSPPEGLITARESASVFRNDEQVEMLGPLLADRVQVGPLLARLNGEQLELLKEANGGKWPQPSRMDLPREWQQKFLESLKKDPQTKKDADELLADVFDTFSKEGGSVFFATATLEFKGKVSLSWYLTPEERKRIEEKAACDLDERILRIAEWWLGRPLDRKAEKPIPPVAASRTLAEPQTAISMGQRVK